nr:hypothetical protein BaRGS_018788 [Batillaria attramentaria]
MGLYPWSGGWHGGESLLAATTIGVHVVNNMTDILPGYRLNIIDNDTQCDPGLGIKIMFEQLHSPPTKIAILGDGCSIVSEATARASHLWNLVQVSYVAKSPSLSDKALYPKFARTSTPDLMSNPARVHLFRYFAWSRIATIHQSYELFSVTIDDLTKKMKAANMTILRSEIFREDPSLQVQSLKDYDCRIIVGAFYEDMAKKVFCEAYKAGLYGRKVVWILPGWFDAHWWTEDGLSTDCNSQQISQAVEGALSVGSIFLNPKNDRSVTGWTPQDFMAVYNETVNGARLPDDSMAPQGFDAVVALALALNHTQQALIDKGSPKRLEHFTYEDSEMGDLLYSSLLNVSFMGLRGPTTFDQNGDPSGLVQLEKVQGGVRQTVALYNPMASDEDRWEWSKDTPLVWEGGSPPRDSVTSRTVYVTLSAPLYIIMCVLASLGVLITWALLAFNIALRNVRVIKMSSPRLNNVILLGCMCGYTSILLQDGGGGHGHIGCEIKTMLFVLGLSMTFGALFAKTWRVHAIFTNKKLRKKVVSDVQLIAVVGVLMALDLLVLVTWWLVDPRQVKVTRESSYLVQGSVEDVLIKECERKCVSHYQLYFLGTLYGIHAIVLIFGTFLAWETRKVHYPELNDSKQIGMCIYNVALLCIPALVVVLMEPGINLHYGVVSALVLVGTTVTQGLIFIPKITAYRQNQVEHDQNHLPKPTTTCDDSSRMPSMSTQAPTHLEAEG